MCVECIGFAAAATAWVGHFYRAHIVAIWYKMEAAWRD